MTIYLYKKTHNKTGLQYLGKTKLDPLKYRGSGKDWEPHIKEHGYDVTTEILRECLTKEELSYWGRYYSKLWNVVDDPNWANRIPETGGGYGRKWTASEKQRQSVKVSGDNNPSKKLDFKEKHSGPTHWMNRPEHSTYVHIMTRPEVKDTVSGKNSIRYNHAVYKFYNTITEEELLLTSYEFRKRFNLDQSCVSRLLYGTFKQYRGWIISQ